MKALLSLCGLLGLFSIGCLAYGALGPWYDPSPLDAPVRLGADSPQGYTFTVERAEHYLIEIEMTRSALSEQEDADFLQAPGAAGESSGLNVRWSLRRGHRLVSKGSARDHGDSHFKGADVIGRTIGRPALERGVRYDLELMTESEHPGLNDATPRVRLHLHPADLEYLIVLRLLGGAGVLVSGFLFAALALSAVIRRRMRQKRAP